MVGIRHEQVWMQVVEVRLEVRGMMCTYSTSLMLYCSSAFLQRGSLLIGVLLSLATALKQQKSGSIHFLTSFHFTHKQGF